MKHVILYLIAIILSPQVISASILVGKTEGSFSVSPSGAATYTIPIKIQKSLSDFVPNISLSYNSQAGNGIAGLGWSISGLSTISIVPRNIYFDSMAEAIYSSEDNAFALDGMRLLLTSGVNGQTGATYRTENEQYNIISITNSSYNTPATFRVKSTDGSVYQYGSSSGKYTLSNGKIYQWALDYAEDVLGNYISYSYSQEGFLYPVSITYGHNTHGTNGVSCVISFNYENRPDSIPSYLFGYQSYLKKRLKSIVCTYNGNTYRTYTLNYSEDTFSRLISVTESGTSSSTLRPTTFEWSIPEFQLTCNSRTVEPATLENPSDEYFFSGDLDGDGITEIITIGYREDIIGNDHWPYTLFWGRKWDSEDEMFKFCYSEQTQSGFQIDKMFKTLRSGGLVMHASHGEENSLVFPFCRINNGIKAFVFTFPKEILNYSIPMKGMSEEIPPYTILDADRNGLDEIFIIEKEKYGNTYPAYLASCNLTTASYSCSETSLDLQGIPDKIRCADFNSDGMVDLLITTTTGYYIYWNKSGTFSDSDRSYSTAFGKCDILEIGDFNGDGLPDLIINNPNSTQWYIAKNTGNDTNGYFALQEISYLSQVGAQNIVGKENKLYCIVQDLDGDGRSDAVVGYPYNNGDGGYICTLKSNGSTLTLISSYDLSNSANYPNISHIIQGNFDGHGGMEIMYYGKGLGQNTTGWHLLKNPSTIASSQKMVSITDGLGAKDSISYGLLTDSEVYSVTQHHSFPLVRLAGSLPVVTSRKESIPSEYRTTNYSYANGILHLHGKGFLGFEDVRTESSTGIVTDTHLDLDSTFYVLLSESIIQKNTAGTQINQITNSTNIRSLGSHTYTTSSTSKGVRNPLDYFSKRESGGFYENGFPTFQVTEDDLFTADREITYWESPLDSVWIKGLPEEILITKYETSFNSDDVYERITYERDPSTGLVLKETYIRNGQTVSTDGYSYNEYGQVILHYTVPFNSTDTLVSRYVYNSKGQLITEYDPRGLMRSYAYRPQYGTLSSILDFDGVRTQYSYDGLFRETNRSTPIESVQTTRVQSSYGGGVYYIKERRTGETPIITYYDAWERKIAEASYLANGTLMYRDYQYLPNGKIGFISFPHKSTETTSEGTTYTYENVAQRLAETLDSNGKRSTWEYRFPGYVLSVIDGITTETSYYTPDKVRDVVDASGWIDYTYNADGNISAIIGEDSETDYTYDLYGRLIRTTDMNGVTKQYSYDSNGHPYRTSIAGSILETNYDKYGILRSKSWTEPGESPHTVNYTYDNRFRLIREEGDGYLNTYDYDSYGRVTNKFSRAGDDHTEGLYVTISYNSDNRVSQTIHDFNTLSWTSSILEQFSYNNGYKISDVLKDTLVWSLTEQDRWGHMTEGEDFLGNTSYEFDDYGNMLYMDRATNSQIDEAYTYDLQTGNMTHKNNTLLTYDSMNRLTGWAGETYSYDDKGNITHQPFVGNFSYNGYRLTNMLAGNNYFPDDSIRISYYTALERPKSIENEQYKANFYYDGNGDRFMMKVFKREGEEFRLNFTRYYLAGNAEVTLDTLGHYSYLYYAGGDAYMAPAVIVIDENENANIYQITRDNLGSAIQYENANGCCYRNSYSSWGVRTYAGEDTIFYQPGEMPAFGPFYRTYTGHEDLWMFGLLNANARLYSPYLGRFVSPDPLLNEDGSPLDFNPYVYARNNPYRYIDRNGEFWWLAPVFIGAAMNAAIYSISAAITGNWNVGDFFKSMGMGAITGGLGIGTSLLSSQLGNFGNSFTYGLLSNMANNTITNTILGEKISFGDVPGMLVGAAISGVLPTFSPIGTASIKNIASEIGFNTLRGGIVGTASGSVNALMYDDPSLIWEGAVSGAISGFSRTTLHAAIMGAPYKEKYYEAEGIYRKGGLAYYLQRKKLIKGRGLTLGRHVYTNEENLNQTYIDALRYHESYHLQQIDNLSVARFYGRILLEYMKYGFHASFDTPSALENDAENYTEGKTGVRLTLRRRK